MSQDVPQRTTLADARLTRMDRPEVAAAYEQTRLRHELAEAGGPSVSSPNGPG